MDVQLMKCSDKSTYDISGKRLLSSITFSGSSTQGARELSIKVVNNGFLYSVGDIINFADGNIFYAGQIQDLNTENKQPTIDLDSIDFMTHLENSKDTMVVDSTPEGVALTICSKLQLAPGSIVPTGIATGKRVYEKKTYYDIITDLYKRAGAINGKKYQVYMIGNMLNVREKGEIVDYELDDSKNCEKVRKTESIKKIINKVVVYDKKHRLKNQKADDTIDRYGIFQDVASEDDNLDEKLIKPQNTLSISGIGNINCISGKYIRFRDSETNIKAIYEIIQDTHNISENYHSMDLELEFVRLA